MEVCLLLTISPLTNRNIENRLKGYSQILIDEIEILAEIQRYTDIARGELGLEPGAPPKSIDEKLSDEYIINLSDRLRNSLKIDVTQRPQPKVIAVPSSTTHISALDEFGNCISLTTSPGFLSGFVVPDTGIVLNNMMGEPDLNPMGFHRYEKGQRVISMMSPTIIASGGKPILATGSGGGNRLRTAIFQVLFRYLLKDFNLIDAVNAPRIVFMNKTLHLEPIISAETVHQLENRGYSINKFEGLNTYFGGTHSVSVRDEKFSGAGDPRREGCVELI
jgi:gamma-glutamyltranspeptidase